MATRSVLLIGSLMALLPCVGACGSVRACVCVLASHRARVTYREAIGIDGRQLYGTRQRNTSTPVYDECALLNSRARYHTAPFTITSDHATFVAS